MSKADGLYYSEDKDVSSFQFIIYKGFKSVRFADDFYLCCSYIDSNFVRCYYNLKIRVFFVDIF